MLFKTCIYIKRDARAASLLLRCQSHMIYIYNSLKLKHSDMLMEVTNKVPYMKYIDSVAYIV